MKDLLPKYLYDTLCSTLDIEDVSELRIRIGKPIRYMVNGAFYALFEGNECVIAEKSLIEYILAIATGHSIYAYNDEMTRGFITYHGGIRIGIAGSSVMTKDKVSAIRDISSLVIRVPMERKGVADNIINVIGSYANNMLILSPPGVGKTTLLRDYIRLASSSGYNVALIDEREEIASMCKGLESMDVGVNTDVLSGVSKDRAYEIALRSLHPDILATDEIFGDNEMHCIEDAVRTGVNVVATIHAKSVEYLYNTPYSRIISLFNYAITLDYGCENRIKSIERIE